ncbi:MAG: hypothetical protein AABZ30_11210 [Myxococcota bacterium]
MLKKAGLTVALVAVAGCGNAPEEGGDQATVVGRIQGTEFPVPAEAAAIWLVGDGMAALRISGATDGCGAPDGWSLRVQVNTHDENEYPIGLAVTDEPGEGFLVEYLREDGTADMPSVADGLLTLTYVGEDFVAGSLSLETDGGAELAVVFEAPLCETTVFVTP